jgi:hypothetical protein
VCERAQQARAERLGQPAAAFAIAADGVEQDRAARRPGLAGRTRQRRAAEQLLDVGEQPSSWRTAASSQRKLSDRSPGSGASRNAASFSPRSVSTS